MTCVSQTEFEGGLQLRHDVNDDRKLMTREQDWKLQRRQHSQNKTET